MLTLDSIDFQNVSNTSWLLRSFETSNHILNSEQFGFIWLSGFIALPLARQSVQVSWGQFSPELTCLRHPFGDVIPKSISLGTPPCEIHLVKEPPHEKMGDNLLWCRKRNTSLLSPQLINEWPFHNHDGHCGWWEGEELQGIDRHASGMQPDPPVKGKIQSYQSGCYQDLDTPQMHKNSWIVRDCDAYAYNAAYIRYIKYN